MQEFQCSKFRRDLSCLPAGLLSGGLPAIARS